MSLHLLGLIFKETIASILTEGGWDTTATQSTVIRPSTVKQALVVANKLAPKDVDAWASLTSFKRQKRLA